MHSDGIKGRLLRHIEPLLPCGADCPCSRTLLSPRRPFVLHIYISADIISGNVNKLNSNYCTKTGVETCYCIPHWLWCPYVRIFRTQICCCKA